MWEMLAFAVAFNLAMFVIAYTFKTDKLTDISYALTFIAVVSYGLLQNPADPTHLLVALAIYAWAVRLGAYLLYRIHKMGKDARFDDIRGNFFRFGRFWLLQGISVWAILLPFNLAVQTPTTELHWLTVAGILLALFGLNTESVADWQKFKFKQNPNNKGKWIDEGLWHYSRHPNYFGEICMWLGIFIACLPVLSGVQIIIAAVSPAYITLLLTKISGIPPLEKYADKKWGDKKAYKEYRATTNVLIPLPKGKGE